ncbi:hypothetical protein [Roseicyclus elongatus]|nr:hypothetical protein [Roseibacterium elongatum]
MNGFLRPEAMAALKRWREVIVVLAVGLLGLWIATDPGPILRGFGLLLAVAAVAALVPAIRRARFAALGDGPGVVQVDERRILYMGPVHGGAVALDELNLISLRRAADGHGTWVLVEGAQVLTIPVNAKGGDALFDAFTALPGLSAQRVLSVLEKTDSGTHRLWARAQPAALTR